MNEKNDFIKALLDVYNLSFCSIEDYQILIKMILTVFINQEKDPEIIAVLTQTIEKSLQKKLNNNNNYNKKNNNNNNNETDLYQFYNNISLRKEKREIENIDPEYKKMFSTRILNPKLHRPNYGRQPKIKD